MAQKLIQLYQGMYINYIILFWVISDLYLCNLFVLLPPWTPWYTYYILYYRSSLKYWQFWEMLYEECTKRKNYLISKIFYLSLLGVYPKIRQVCKMSINLLTLAGLWKLFGYNHGFHVYWQFCLYPRSVHKPARVIRFVTLGPATPKAVHRPAKVSRFMTWPYTC